MAKTLTVAASVVMLITIAVPAFAETTAPDAHYGIEAISSSDRQADYVFNAFDPSATDAINAHRYHGGPKSND